MKTLIVIGGPTASGKTAFAIQLATHFGTAILSADSRQCYREMNIGVAKPSPDQLEAVTHYFINTHSIHEEVSAGVFERYGLEVLSDLFSKNDTVVCVGGTGLYIKALCEGIDSMPAPDKEIDARVNEDYRLGGIAWLRDQIIQHDPLFVEQGEMENPARMLRALVFKLSTGESIYQYRKSRQKTRDFKVKYFAIDVPKEQLYANIDQRVDEMIIAGLEAEALALFPHRQLKALQTVGYKEFFDFFEQRCSREDAISKIKQHSRNYAKRQLTWFRHQGDYTLVAPHYENIIKALLI